MLWCPVMTVAALLHGLAFRRSEQCHPEPFLAGLFVAAAGLLVIPADLEMADLDGTVSLIAGCGGALVCAVAVYFGVRVTRAWLGDRRFAHTLGAAAAVGMIVTSASGIALFRSPFYDADRFRVAPAGATRQATNRPNVLWIVLDTVRPDRLSCYDDTLDSTPFLTEWARRAIVFDHAVGNGVWTVPSHASMFTGRSIREHGMDHANLWLDDAFETVAEVLADSGYATASFSNNPWISRDSNLAQGFENVRVNFYLSHLGRFSLIYLCEKWGVSPPVPWLDADFGAAMTNHLIARWLDDEADPDAPLFLFVNYMEALLPYRIPRRYRRMYLTDEQTDRSYALRRRAYGDIVTALDSRFNIEGSEFLPEADREILKRQYDATLRYLDDRVRELIDMFDQRGLLDDTLVVITSDHGEHLDTHGMWSHGILTYNDVARVTMLIHEPGQEVPARVSTAVLLSDLHPTILNATLKSGGRGPGHDARDLIALARSDDQSRTVVTEYTGPSNDTTRRINKTGDPIVHHRAGPQIAAQDGRFKYIASSDGRRELYDLTHDPQELNNLFEIQVSESKRLAAHIDAWLQAVPPYQPTQPGVGTSMPPDVVDALRSLGYLNTGDD